LNAQVDAARLNALGTFAAAPPVCEALPKQVHGGSCHENVTYVPGRLPDLNSGVNHRISHAHHLAASL
jgi:hypothetical protein